MRSLISISILLIAFTASILIACSDDGDTNGELPGTPLPTVSPSQVATDTPEAGETATPPPTDGTASPSPSASPGQIDESSVSRNYQDIIASIYEECTGDLTDSACLTGVVEDAGVSEAVVAFWQAHESFLVDFEKHGAVDFGAVSSPVANMARPEPVFLNGDFGLMYVGEVIPQDWQEEPTYQSLPDAIAWIEYGSLVDATADAGQQVFAVALPIRECRACEDLGSLALEVSFEDGAYSQTVVLPFTSESSDADPAPTP